MSTISTEFCFAERFCSQCTVALPVAFTQRDQRRRKGPRTLRPQTPVIEASKLYLGASNSLAPVGTERNAINSLAMILRLFSGKKTASFALR